MPIYNKAPLNAAQQVAHLQWKGMLVQDVAAAEFFLSRIGLYRFKGYAHFWKDASSQLYVNVSFDDVRRLMELDEELRLHVLRGVQILEIALRIRISEHMTLAYHPHWYAGPLVMLRERGTGKQRKKMLASAENIAAKAYSDFLRSSDDSPRHYRKHYDAWVLPPSWMMTEVLSFGIWSRIFASLDTNDQDSIGQSFGIHRDILRTWLNDLSVLRNASAHHARLWNKKFVNARLYEPDPLRPQLTLLSYRQSTPETTLAPRLYAMHHLLTQIGVITWTPQLGQVVSAFPSTQLQHLGLRPGWEVQPEWL